MISSFRRDDSVSISYNFLLGAPRIATRPHLNANARAYVGGDRRFLSLDLLGCAVGNGPDGPCEANTPVRVFFKSAWDRVPSPGRRRGKTHSGAEVSIGSRSRWLATRWIGIMSCGYFHIATGEPWPSGIKSRT